MRIERHGFSVVALSVLAVGNAAADPPPAPLQYTVTEIPLPPEAAVCATGFQHIIFARRLNESAEAAGYYYCYVATGDPATPYLSRGARAFRWSPITGSTELPFLNASSHDSLGRDINEAGTVVGSESTVSGDIVPTSWPAAGGVAQLFMPQKCSPYDYTLGMAEAINDNGTIASRDLRWNAGQCGLRVLLKLVSGQQVAGPLGTPYSINNDDAIVGRSDDTRSAIKWSPALGTVVLSPPPGPSPSRATAWDINNAGQAVGFAELSGPVNGKTCLLDTAAKLWAADGTETSLPGIPGAINTAAYGINIHGVAVGWSNFVAPCASYDQALVRAVVWIDGAIHDLNALVPPAFAQDVQLTVASDINDSGQILASGFRINEPKAPCPNIVYDPETWEPYYDDSLLCHTEYTFLLTPQD